MISTWHFLPGHSAFEQEESDIKMAMDEDNQNPNSTKEFLTPLAKMKKYADSDNIFERETVVRSILETMRSVVDNPEDIDTMVGILWKLSEDIEPSVRTKLMQQIPQIALLCHEFQGRMLHVAFQFLLPVVVSFLQDTNNEVRKTSQAALLIMLEQELVNKDLLEDQVCPIIVRLSQKENYDNFRTEAVALMSKMAPMVGKEITQRLFLQTFADLCLDAVFPVRQVCAANFGEMCTVIGTEATEKFLLPRFSYLCEDGIWNVRKACADVFTTVSYTCTLETRHNRLAPLFVNLLCDQNRWVRLAAFQALGLFISTFADPTYTGLYFSEDGMHIVRDQRFYEKDFDNYLNINEGDLDALINSEFPAKNENCDKENAEERSEKEKTAEKKLKENTADEDTNTSTENRLDNDKCSELTMQSDSGSNSERLVMGPIETGNDCVRADAADQAASDNLSQKQLTVTGTLPGHMHVHLDESAFNSFHYWRVPIPEIELDIDVTEGKPTSVSVRAKVQTTLNGPFYSSELSVSLCQDERKEISGLPSDAASTTSDSGGGAVALEYTRIRTASIGMIQEDSTQGSGAQRVLGTSANEAVVTTVNGSVEDVTQSYVHCGSPQSTKDDICFENLFKDSLTLDNYNSRRFDVFPTCNKNQMTKELKAQIINQSIVPCELLEHYIMMTDPSQTQTLDNDIARHCAYSLPAVAMTLGRRNWPILKRLYESLASDMQWWKVRRTIAFSIHELAVILGEDLACKDLVPIFNGFIKDLDDVRIGVLSHISDFLKQLHPREHREYLPRLPEFLNIDNNCNWRFRLEMAEQLAMLASLYQPVDIREYLLPIAITLMSDKVAQVRQVAVKSICVLIREVNNGREPSLVKSFLGELAEQFAHHKKWTRRQTFACLCHHLITKNALHLQQFAHDLLPHLLDLSYDPVPNVRLSVANTLSQTIIPLDYYSSHHNPYHELLIEVIRRLQVDQDRDVRYFANLPPQNSAGDQSPSTAPQMVLPV